jgi:hypothetical protein
MRARRLAGLVREQCLRLPLFAFSTLSRRAMVADPMWRSAAHRGSGSVVPLLSRARRSSGMAACSLPPQSSLARWYTQTSASTTAGPYTCFRCLRQGEGLGGKHPSPWTKGLGGIRVTPPRIARLAEVRSRYAAYGGLYPVVAQNSCNITPFSFFRARRYRRATSLPICLFSCIVSTMTPLLSRMLTQACQHHGYPLSVHDDSFVMQRREFTRN